MAKKSKIARNNQRRVIVERNTSETKIKLSLDLDGSGTKKIETQLPFFTHMLEAFARHGLFDVELLANGDVEIDGHHVVEDVGLVLRYIRDRAKSTDERITLLTIILGE